METIYFLKHSQHYPDQFQEVIQKQNELLEMSLEAPKVQIDKYKIEE